MNRTSPNGRPVRALAAFGVTAAAVASAFYLAGSPVIGATAATPGRDVKKVIAEAQAALRQPAQQADLEPLSRHRRTSVSVVDRVSNHHIHPAPLDDAASVRVLHRYLRDLDPQRMHFLATDVKAFGKYRHALDDALQEGDLEPAFDIYNIYRRRALARVEYEMELLEAGIEQFDFTLDEVIETDRLDAEWPATAAEQRELWRLSLKSRVLSGKLSDEPLEDIAEVLAKRAKNRLRMIGQTRSEDAFRIYINAFAGIYDRHTQYFSPRESQAFNISMSLSLEGIGAVLGVDDDYTVVERLVKGGPADRQGELQPADRIIAVSQSAKEPFVDIVGWRTDDVVQLIRGPKDSPVLLKVIPAGADTSEQRVVEIVRNVVQLEDQSVSKTMLPVERDGREHRVGVIDVPIFYLDFEGLQAGDPNARSTTRDVARLVDELKAEGMDALIVDLRNNGGGSLKEAVELTGLFLDSGPVVQVSDLRRPPSRHRDTDGKSAWSGPLAVMVNQLSASASEIFAGAVQDHGIGIVVGAQTFGKGTVQMLIDLGSGQLKLTRQKFFRVSGEGTERNGVRPDIAYPLPVVPMRSLFAHEDAIGTPGDPLPPVDFKALNLVAPFLDALRERHAARVADDPEFVYLRGWKAHTEDIQERSALSLNEAARERTLAERRDALLALENARLVARGEAPAETLQALNERRREENAEESAAEDPLVEETANILLDYIALAHPRRIAQANTAETSPPERGLVH